MNMNLNLQTITPKQNKTKKPKAKSQKPKAKAKSQKQKQNQEPRPRLQQQEMQQQKIQQQKMQQQKRQPMHQMQQQRQHPPPQTRAASNQNNTSVAVEGHSKSGKLSSEAKRVNVFVAAQRMQMAQAQQTVTMYALIQRTCRSFGVIDFAQLKVGLPYQIPELQRVQELEGKIHAQVNESSMLSNLLLPIFLSSLCCFLADV
jgi:hypothetical protein